MMPRLNRQYWVTLWQRLTKPAPEVQGDAERQRARMLAGLSAALLPLAIVIVTIWVLANPDFTAAPFISIALIASYGITYYLSRTPHYDLGTLIFVSVLLVILVVIFYTAPGPPSRRALAFMYMVVAILLASIFSTFRNTLIVAGVSFTITAGILFTSDLPFAETYSFLTFIATMTLLITVAARISNAQLRQIAKQTQSLSDSEERYRNVLAAIPDAIYTLDLATQQSTFYKDNFLGYNQDELQAPGSIMHTIHAEDNARVMEHWGEIWHDHPPHITRIDFRLQAKSGAWEWVQMRSVVNKRNPDGTVRELLFVLSVITQAKDAQKRNLELAIQQERLAFLNNLIRGASHDLKTPIAALNSTLYLLNKAKDDEKKQRYSERLSQQIEDFSQLVTTLFDLTRLETGAVLTFASVDINPLINRVCTRLQSLFKLNQLTLDCELQNTSLTVLGDANELERVFANLLGNAAKYTKEGGQVTIRCYRADHHIVIDVADTGIGIAADVLPRIFEPFFQADDAKQHHSDGTGIGLALVKQIVDMHRGTIEVSSTPNQGSQFKIMLPIASDMSE